MGGATCLSIPFPAITIHIEPKHLLTSPNIPNLSKSAAALRCHPEPPAPVSRNHRTENRAMYLQTSARTYSNCVGAKQSRRAVTNAQQRSHASWTYLSSKSMTIRAKIVFSPLTSTSNLRRRRSKSEQTISQRRRASRQDDPPPCLTSRNLRTPKYARYVNKSALEKTSQTADLSYSHVNVQKTCKRKSALTNDGATTERAELLRANSSSFVYSLAAFKQTSKQTSSNRAITVYPNMIKLSSRKTIELEKNIKNLIRQPGDRHQRFCFLLPGQG